MLEVQGLSAEQIGDVAFEHRIRVHGLAVQQASLEEAFMEMTRDSVEFHAHSDRCDGPVRAAARPGRSMTRRHARHDAAGDRRVPRA